MKVRIPLSRGEDGAPVDEEGECAFVIVDTDKIETIVRATRSFNRAAGKPATLETKTVLHMSSGLDVEFDDKDLCTGWTHDALLEALDWPDDDGYFRAGWNPSEAAPKKPKRARKK